MSHNVTTLLRRKNEKRIIIIITAVRSKFLEREKEGNIHVNKKESTHKSMQSLRALKKRKHQIRCVSLFNSI